MNTESGAAGTPLLEPRSELEALGLAYVRSFNDRDVDGLVALSHPDIVGNPSRPFGGGTYQGHDGLRRWWQGVAARGVWYDIVVAQIQHVERRIDDRRNTADRRLKRRASATADLRANERRRVDAHKLAMFGDICLDGEPLAPWASVLIIQRGLIIRQRSYLSTRSLLEEIGIVAEPPRLTPVTA